GRQVSPPAHVEEGRKVVEGEAGREARQGRQEDPDRHRPARQEV
ncbi:MAG: hypothetical protein AVDCRST_MAG29-2523, partial [uncultured Nocardioidaceae bacterium]